VLHPRAGGAPPDRRIIAEISKATETVQPSIQPVERQRWKVVRLEDVEAVAWRGTELTWRPLRAALGATLVGISAYTTSRAGQEVVEDHIESRDGRGHEEVYVVLRGRAAFTLDGERMVAGPETFLVVDPEVRRSAVSLDPETVVLAIGGPKNFEAAASEWIDRARPYLHDDPPRARAIIDELRRERPDSPAVHLGEALFAAAQGDQAAARQRLAEGITTTPKLRDYALTEPSLAHLVPHI
jgi:mannose-6-phosphate isomerase-like protein (cupin superfamily)